MAISFTSFKKSANRKAKGTLGRRFQSRRYRFHAQHRPARSFWHCRRSAIQKHDRLDRAPQNAAQLCRFGDITGGMTARQIFAWLVHLYSALGAVIAFIAVLLIDQLQFREAFFLMALAVLIDASDGT